MVGRTAALMDVLKTVQTGKALCCTPSRGRRASAAAAAAARVSQLALEPLLEVHKVSDSLNLSF